MDSACRFDLHILSNVLFEKRNIREIRAFCREPGRCLDIIRPALCDAFARKDLLLFRQKAGLDDDLQHMIPDRLFDRRDFVRDVLRIPVFQRADVEDDVDLIRPVKDRLPGLENLRRLRHISQREPCDSADPESRMTFPNFLYKR